MEMRLSDGDILSDKFKGKKNKVGGSPCYDFFNFKWAKKVIWPVLEHKDFTEDLQK